jgi:hypothetical protein
MFAARYTQSASGMVNAFDQIFNGFSYSLPQLRQQFFTHFR